MMVRRPSAKMVNPLAQAQCLLYVSVEDLHFTAQQWVSCARMAKRTKGRRPAQGEVLQRFETVWLVWVVTRTKSIP